MSIISEQIKELRALAGLYMPDKAHETINKAADTIEALSAKLAKENSEILSTMIPKKIDENKTYTDCEYYRAQGFNSCIDEILSKLTKANMERSEAYYGGGWIPCGKRLPRDMEDVLISMAGIKAAPAYLRNKKWYLTDCRGSSTEVKEQGYITAWRPLPDPYTEK